MGTVRVASERQGERIEPDRTENGRMNCNGNSKKAFGIVDGEGLDLV
jgi:hypothetical protein